MGNAANVFSTEAYINDLPVHHRNDWSRFASAAPAAPVSGNPGNETPKVGKYYGVTNLFSSKYNTFQSEVSTPKYNNPELKDAELIRDINI